MLLNRFYNPNICKNKIRGNLSCRIFFCNQKMKIYYWSPFFTNIATIKAVIRSAEAFVKFSKENKIKCIFN